MVRINGHIRMGGATRHFENCPDQFLSQYRGADDSKTIKKCLSCTKTECDNCLNPEWGMNGNKIGRPASWSVQQMIELAKCNAATYTIRMITGADYRTIKRYKEKYAPKEETI